MINVKVRDGFNIVECTPTKIKMELLWMPDIWIICSLKELDSSRVLRKLFVNSTSDNIGAISSGTHPLKTAIDRLFRDIKNTE
jgi:hypothetical protein